MGRVKWETRRASRICLIAIGLLSLFSPLVFVVTLSLIKPEWAESLVNKFVGLEYAYFHEARSSGHPMTFHAVLFHALLYAERFVIEMVIRSINHVRTTGMLTAEACGIILLVGWSRTRWLKKTAWREVLSPLAFFLLFLAFAKLWGAPAPVLLSSVVTCAYIVNFQLAGIYGRLLTRRLGHWINALTIFLAPWVSHVLIPELGIQWIAWCFRPEVAWSRRIALRSGRWAACLVTIPGLMLVVLSFYPLPLSKHAVQELNFREMYDIELDLPGEQVLTTVKRSNKGFAFPLLDDRAPARVFSIPTDELEDIAIDPVKRLVYHVDQESNTIYVMDLDQLKPQRSKRIAAYGNGSTRVALSRTTNRLFIMYENDNIVFLDQDSLETLGCTPPSMETYWRDILSDDRNSMVYLNGNYLYALDARELKVIRKVKGPNAPDRMAFSPNRNELYVPDPIRARIWVYSTPQLDLIRRIPTSLGVRSLAIDEAHNLLLAVNYFTGYVDVYDLDSSRRVGHEHIDSALRSVKLDIERRRAYVTSAKSGLYRLDY